MLCPSVLVVLHTYIQIHTVFGWVERLSLFFYFFNLRNRPIPYIVVSENLRIHEWRCNMMTSFFFLTTSFIADHESNYRMAEPSCFVFIMDQNNFESQCEVSIESYFLQSATVSHIFGWVRSLLCGVGLFHLLIMAVKCESAKLDLFQNNWLWLNSCCLSVEGNCGHYTLWCCFCLVMRARSPSPP